jgi:hypothetical protein
MALQVVALQVVALQVVAVPAAALAVLLAAAIGTGQQVVRIGRPASLIVPEASAEPGRHLHAGAASSSATRTTACPGSRAIRSAPSRPPTKAAVA